MKVNELRPCDCCDGPLRVQGCGNFYVVRTSIAIWNAAGINSHLGLAQMMGGGGFGMKIAEVMGTNPEAAIVVGDKEPSMMTELYLCFNCWIGGTLNLAVVTEKVLERRDADKSAMTDNPD